MKKIILMIMAVVLMASTVWAAGTCSQKANYDSKNRIVVILTCTGATNGSVSTTTINEATMASLIKKYHLYTVTAYPTSGGTAPDAADVTVNMNGLDLLGGKGTNLIHATATRDTFPYSSFMSGYRYPLITGTITVAVANQGTNGANWTIELVFEE